MAEESARCDNCIALRSFEISYSCYIIHRNATRHSTPTYPRQWRA